MEIDVESFSVTKIFEPIDSDIDISFRLFPSFAPNLELPVTFIQRPSLSQGLYYDIGVESFYCIDGDEHPIRKPSSTSTNLFGFTLTPSASPLASEVTEIITQNQQIEEDKPKEQQDTQITSPSTLSPRWMIYDIYGWIKIHLKKKLDSLESEEIWKRQLSNSWRKLITLLYIIRNRHSLEVEDQISYSELLPFTLRLGLRLLLSGLYTLFPSILISHNISASGPGSSTLESGLALDSSTSILAATSSISSSIADISTSFIYARTIDLLSLLVPSLPIREDANFSTIAMRFGHNDTDIELKAFPSQIGRFLLKASKSTFTRFGLWNSESSRALIRSLYLELLEASPNHQLLDLPPPPIFSNRLPTNLRFLTNNNTYINHNIGYLVEDFANACYQLGRAIKYAAIVQLLILANYGQEIYPFSISKLKLLLAKRALEQAYLLADGLSSTIRVEIHRSPPLKVLKKQQDKKAKNEAKNEDEDEDEDEDDIELSPPPILKRSASFDALDQTGISVTAVEPEATQPLALRFPISLSWTCDWFTFYFDFDFWISKTSSGWIPRDSTITVSIEIWSTWRVFSKTWIILSDQLPTTNFS